MTESAANLKTKLGLAWHVYGNDHCDQVGHVTGAGDPNGVLTPSYVGQEYYDTTNKQFYRSIDTTSTSWVPSAGNAGGLNAVLTANFRNILDGGDFTVNPFQRGTSQAADIANTLTYGPDRFFFVGGASSAINWSKQANTNVAGFSQAVRFQRKSGNADTAAIKMGQVIETADSVRLQSLPVTLSFWAKTGANYSGGNLTVQFSSGTGSDEGAASLVAATWTGQANAISATQALTTTMTRYQFSGTVPAGATELGMLLLWTPAGTAGANDFIEFEGFQLEIGTDAGPFEHRDVQVELEICQRYYWQINEPATAVVVGTGSLNSTTAAIIYMATPVQMRTAPTVTVTAGTFHAAPAGVAASGTIAAGSTHTPNAITINVTGITASTAGFGTPLVGAGGTGKINVSADL